MRGKFNYFVFFLRIIFAVIFLPLSIAAIIFCPGESLAHHDLAGVIAVTFAFFLLLFYVNFKIGRAIWTERFTMRIEAGSIVITDLFTFKKRVLHGADIKGFSLAEYPLRGLKVKSILLYLVNGQKIEFPQFLFYNFKRLNQALQENGIRFLGEEPFVWKWVDSRYYKFDE